MEQGTHKELLEQKWTVQQIILHTAGKSWLVSLRCYLKLWTVKKDKEVILC